MLLCGNMPSNQHHILWGKLRGFCILLPLISPLSCLANFSQAKELIYKIIEGLPQGTFIGAIGADLQLNFSVHPPLLFNLALKISQQYVNLNGTTGELYTSTSVIDRETLCQGMEGPCDCSLSLDIFILPQQYFQLVKVKIFVEDVNDYRPSFLLDEIQLLVPENVPVNSRFALDQSAVDPDAGINGVQTYWLVDDFGVFTLDVEESEGGELAPILIVTGPLDRETIDTYETSIIAEDGGTPPLLGTATLRIIVTDVNDNCPQFRDKQINITLYENTTKGSHLAHLHAHDPDLGANAKVTYAYSDRVPREVRALFHLDKVTGVIKLSGKIDSNTAKFYKVNVLANGPACIPAVTMVMVHVMKFSSGPPAVIPRYIALEKNGVVWLKESELASSPIAFFTVKNGAETGPKVECHLEGDGPFRLTPFKLFTDEYLLETTGVLDYEERQEYELTIVARNSHGMVIKTLIRILVTDENDNAPIFKQAQMDLLVEENNSPNTFLAKLHATDKDSGIRGEVIYLLGSDAPSIFYLDQETGALTVSTSLDREEQEKYRFTVRALDRGSPRQEAAGTVVITVVDRNDNSPRFINKDFTFFVPENFPGFSEIGVLSVTDADSGKNGWVALSIINGSDIFIIDTGKGALRAKMPLDREQQGTYFLWIKAVDGGEPSLSCITMVTVLLLDVNDNPPLVLFPQSNQSYMLVLPNTQPGTAITEVYAVDKDTGMNAVIAYSIIKRKGGEPGSFDIDPDTGNITLRKTLDDRGLYSLLVKVSDHGQPEPLHSMVLVNLFVNESISNVSYIQSLLMREEEIEIEEAPLGRRTEGRGKDEGFPCRLMVMALSITSLSLLLLLVLLTTYICCQVKIYKHSKLPRKKEANPEFQDVDRKLMEISHV